MINWILRKLAKITILGKIFEKLGEVDYIRIKQSKKFSSAFIYMKNWNFSSSLVMKFYNKIADGDEINLIYNFPWFWKCRANHDIRELKFNKLENQTVQYKENINNLKKENWNLKSYARWLMLRRNAQTI